MNTCDAIMERTIFVFSLASSSFSLRVRAARTSLGHRLRWTRRSEALLTPWTRPWRPSKARTRLEGEAGVPDPAASPGGAHRPCGPQTARASPTLFTRSLIVSPSPCEHSFNELGDFHFIWEKKFQK